MLDAPPPPPPPPSSLPPPPEEETTTTDLGEAAAAADSAGLGLSHRCRNRIANGVVKVMAEMTPQRALPSQFPGGGGGPGASPAFLFFVLGQGPLPAQKRWRSAPDSAPVGSLARNKGADARAVKRPSRPF